MKKKAIAALVAGVLLLAACGREGGEEQLDITAQGTTEPTATAKADDAEAKATPTPKADAEATPTPAATTAAAANKTPAPAAKAAEGDLNQPKAGTYTYDLEGKASDPFNPAAGEQAFDGEMSAKISHSGAVTTREQTNSEQPGVTTVRTKRETDRIVLLSFKQETAQGDFSCTFDPAPEIAHIPVKVEKFPTQQLKGQGNACGGTLNIDVQRKETVPDATGKTWDTWRILVDQTTETSQFKIHSIDTRWISPDLGVEVASNGKTNGEIKAGATSQKFSGTAKTALRKRP